MTCTHFAEGQVLFREKGKSSSEREIRRTVFFASSAVPSTYSVNSMATPSFSARLAQGSL
jgi:hypothetical protein